MGPKIQTKWPKEEEDLLLSLLKRGLSSAEIGEVMKKSRNSVIGKVNRLGVRILNSTKKNRKQEYVGFDPFPEKSKCCWSIGRGWCQAEAIPGLPYCQEHQYKAYRHPTPKIDVDALASLN